MKKRGSTGMIVGVVIAIVVLIFAAGYFMFGSGPETCEARDTENERSTCYNLLAEENSDPSLCEKVTKDNFRRDICYAEIAADTKDASLCEKVVNDYQKETCLYHVDLEING